MFLRIGAARRGNCRGALRFFCSLSGADAAARTAFGAFSAADALRIINDGEIVLHRDGALRAYLGAFSAADAAHFAHVHDRLASVMRRARNIHLCVGGDAVKEFLRTGEHTRPAGDAPVSDFGAAILDADGIFGADARTVAVAEASVLARLVSAREFFLFRAIGCAVVDEGVCGVIPARAAAYAHGGLSRCIGDA